MQRLIKRFSAFVTSLSKEPFGPIGYLEVDADSGIILADDPLAEEIARHGERLERALLPSTE